MNCAVLLKGCDRGEEEKNRSLQKRKESQGLLTNFLATFVCSARESDYAAEILPTFVERREIFREAVLLCKMPCDAALS